jgi:hypothetical protein
VAPVHGRIARPAAEFDSVLQCEGLLDKTSTASSVWAGSASCLKANEIFLAKNFSTSKIHRKKPQGRPIPKRTARANAKKSAVRARVEHVFAEQKHRMALCVLTIGLARAEFKIGTVNLVYNIRRTLWLDRRAAPE